MNRRKFLKVGAISAGAVLVGGVGGKFALDHRLATKNEILRPVLFSSLKEAQQELDRLEKIALLAPQKVQLLGDWSLHQNLVHCAQSIEYSLTGFPKHRPKIIQNTIGKIVFDKFDAQGYMSHDRNDPIPDAIPIEKEGDLEAAFDRVRKSISDFENHQTAYEPHFMYGKLTKSQYERTHYLHLADHLTGIKG